MLLLTAQAAEAIRGIIADANLGPDAGLRISGTHGGNGESALEFELATTARDGDQVLREGEAVVFLDETAAALLAEKTLDVHPHGDHFHFSLDEQEAAG